MDMRKIKTSPKHKNLLVHNKRHRRQRTKFIYHNIVFWLTSSPPGQKLPCKKADVNESTHCATDISQSTHCTIQDVADLLFLDEYPAALCPLNSFLFKFLFLWWGFSEASNVIICPSVSMSLSMKLRAEQFCGQRNKKNNDI